MSDSTAIKILVELCPPELARNVQGYIEKVSRLFELTPYFSLVSKPAAGQSGYERAFRMAQQLLRCQPDLKLTMHLTCRDLDLGNIEYRLKSLAALGIEGVFIITGECLTYTDQPESSFRSSLELISYICRQFGGLFKQVGAAAYPSESSAQAVQALESKIKAGANLVISQCVFGVKYDTKLIGLLKSNKAIDFYPSVALFNHLSSLENCYRLIKVDHDEKLFLELQKRVSDRKSSAEFSKNYLRGLLASLLSDDTVYVTGLNICPFGNFDLAFELVREITSSERNVCVQSMSA